MAYLLDINVKPVVQDSAGVCPLHWACCSGSLELVELLLKPVYRAEAMVHLADNQVSLSPTPTRTRNLTLTLTPTTHQGYPPHMWIDVDHGDGKKIWDLLVQQHGADDRIFLELRATIGQGSASRAVSRPPALTDRTRTRTLTLTLTLTLP